MEKNVFLSKSNVNTLWDVISDEDIFKFLTKDIQTKISDVFINNLKGFFETEKKSGINLIELNKKYIILILNYIKKNFPYQPNKIKIYEEQPKELITYEEIQNERKTQFDRDLQMRQKDFEDSINIKAPPVPKFTDNYEDKPINEMDKMLKEITSKRNYEVENINRTYNSNISQVNNWLTPQETSIKNEKITQKNQQNSESNSNKLKYLNNENNISINDNQTFQTKKNVTWGENIELNFTEMSNLHEETNEVNLFSKFKKIKKPEIDDGEKTIFLNDNQPDKNSNKNDNSYNKNDNERLLQIENDIKNINLKLDKLFNVFLTKP